MKLPFKLHLPKSLVNTVKIKPNQPWKVPRILLIYSEGKKERERRLRE
jgi:hypothetical protein